MREEGGYSAGSIFLSFLLGGIVGAGLALLLAPESGSETRKRIKDFAEDVKDKAKDYTEEMKGKITSSMEKGKELYEEKKSIITTAFEAGKEAYEKEKEKEKPAKGQDA
ncbi:MAG: YtxH domain-containing protein [Nitrospirota bacterium]|nr:YtxH domain-containing protein [Nitrospirota bacterium]MDH5768747.1 YtxH domain-containing protein [Nitrospirota bacterium]